MDERKFLSTITAKMVEASFYERRDEKAVQCFLCAHQCVIQNEHLGVCKVRKNQGRRLQSLNYGRLIAAHADPVEKKPLYHFLPGTKTFSIAAPGCNFRCDWCQNWEISQVDPLHDYARMPVTMPKTVIEQAINAGCESIAYTYTEPTVFYEFTRETAKLAKTAGLKNIYVSNGYMSKQVLAEMAEWLDAANIDIKAFSDSVYRTYTGAHLRPVLDACRELRKAGVWLEITTLLVPGVNDDEQQLKGLAEFIVNDLGAETPWHLSRYFPQYHSHAPVTPVARFELAESIGKTAGLKFIYRGNVGSSVGTYCPNCGHQLLVRNGYELYLMDLVAGDCPVCQTKIAGVWTGDSGSL